MTSLRADRAAHPRVHQMAGVDGALTLTIDAVGMDNEHVQVTLEVFRSTDRAVRVHVRRDDLGLDYGAVRLDELASLMEALLPEDSGSA